jgi:hypothetical protein
MKKILVSAALVLSLMSVPAFAKGKPAGRGNEKHDEKSEKWKDKDKDKDKDHKKEWRDHDRDRDHGRVANNGRPPGWDKGKKTGWGNCDVPPGQAKKEGCRGTTSHRTVTTQRRTYPARTYPRRTDPTRRRTTTTTTTTTTTSTAQPQQRSGHPFEPVLRQKQAGGKDQPTLKQSVK